MDSNFQYRRRRLASGRSLRAQRVETYPAKREFGSDSCLLLQGFLVTISIRRRITSRKPPRNRSFQYPASDIVTRRSRRSARSKRGAPSRPRSHEQKKRRRLRHRISARRPLLAIAVQPTTFIPSTSMVRACVSQLVSSAGRPLRSVPKFDPTLDLRASALSL